MLSEVGGHGDPPTGNRLVNNIIFQSQGGHDILLEQPEAWSVDHNLWPDGVPVADDGAGSISGDAGLVGPILGDDRGFQVQSGSAAIGAAMAFPEVPTDS